MRSVGLKTLKNKLSEYVRIAASGETVLVTDRDRVVAELVPPNPSRSRAVVDAKLAHLVRKGWLTPPSMRGSGPPDLRQMPLEKILEDLRADRDAR